jgi:hypothetical protein
MGYKASWSELLAYTRSSSDTIGCWQVRQHDYRVATCYVTVADSCKFSFSWSLWEIEHLRNRTPQIEEIARLDHESAQDLTPAQLKTILQISYVLFPYMFTGSYPDDLRAGRKLQLRVNLDGSMDVLDKETSQSVAGLHTCTIKSANYAEVRMIINDIVIDHSLPAPEVKSINEG